MAPSISLSVGVPGVGMQTVISSSYATRCTLFGDDMYVNKGTILHP